MAERAGCLQFVTPDTIVAGNAQVRRRERVGGGGGGMEEGGGGFVRQV